MKPAKRQRGLGRRLMGEAEGWLRERGAVKTHLMVRDTNAESVGFYRQLGYEDANVTVLARWLVDPA